MLRLIYTVGLPGSGKSTWAKLQLRIDSDTYRVCRDDMRAMFHNLVWSDAKEEFILSMRDKAIIEVLKSRHSVIVDDINLNPSHEKRFYEIQKDLLSQFGLKVHVIRKDFFLDLPIDECITRDLVRPNSVGEKVIRHLHNEYVKTEDERYIKGELE